MKYLPAFTYFVAFRGMAHFTKMEVKANVLNGKMYIKYDNSVDIYEIVHSENNCYNLGEKV